jgi:hypothetical protein
MSGGPKNTAPSLESTTASRMSRVAKPVSIYQYGTTQRPSYWAVQALSGWAYRLR